MKHLHRASWAIFIVGVVIAVVAGLADLNATWLIGGVLLAWAGFVKIVIVQLWSRLAKLGTDQHKPEPSL